MTVLAEAARALSPWIIERRRHIHQNPELSFQEFETSAYIAAELRAMGWTGFKEKVGGKCGIMLEVPGQDRSAPMVALRADMDALPIQEEYPSDIMSRNPGVAHMCGHDAHTAMLLGAAKLVHERRDRLRRGVRFFFQHAEELSPGGAIDFIREGWLEGVSRCFGLHVDPSFDAGTICVTRGKALAGVNEFWITIRGKGGHAAYPQETCDPVLAGAHVITALQHIVSRRISPFEPGVVSVTRMVGGSAFNVIPGEVRLNGTTRTYNPAMQKEWKSILEHVADSTARTFGCSATVEITDGFPPLINDDAATDHLLGVAERTFGAAALRDREPVMGGEDFAFFSSARPSCFAYVGVSAPQEKERYFLHHPKFHLDESALWHGSALMAAIALEE